MKKSTTKVAKTIITIILIATSFIAVSFVESAYAGINEDVRAYAQEKWAGNYKMQVYEINKIKKSSRELSIIIDTYGSNMDIVKVINSAYKKWYPQINMVVYEVKKQIKAYKELGNTFSSSRSVPVPEPKSGIRCIINADGSRTFTNH